MSQNGLENCIAKLNGAGIDDSFVQVFSRFYRLQEASQTGELSEYIKESEVSSLREIQDSEQITDVPNVDKLVALVKLNGGLGTTMGLSKAKSLLEVRDGLTFLDIIAKNVMNLRSVYGTKTFPLIFMNSFNTSDDTGKFLKNHYPRLFKEQPVAKSTGFWAKFKKRHIWEFVQHQEPKLTTDTLEPVDFPANRSLEWCPPGHGDFYSAFYSSGTLDALLDSGFKYIFLSNADNLGATYDSNIAGYFAQTGATIMLELTDKTEHDIKGGHIVIKDGNMMLREVAQICDEDKEIAFDIENHPYFNTNSIWFNLEGLKEELDKTNGVLELPLITNHKHVDPKDAATESCIQLESAIGAGISVIKKTEAIRVPRSRFLPVKTHEDLEKLSTSDLQFDTPPPSPSS